MVGAVKWAPAGVAAGAFRPMPDLACSTSRATTRPCGPVPVTIATSTPASLARRRASGEENTRPPWPLLCAAGAAACDVGAAVLGAAGAGADAAAGASGALGGAAEALGLAALLPAAFTSSPSPASTAITSLTGTSCVPSGTRILAIVPSSIASTSMVALSVSISAMTSPDLTLSPSFFSHLARLPFSIVGERAGIRMLMGMLTSRRTLQYVVPGTKTKRPGLVADVALPEALIGRDGTPVLHHGDGAVVRKVDPRDAELVENVLGALEGDGLSDHHELDLEQRERTGTHRAWRQRGVHDGIVERNRTRLAQATHLAVQDRIVLLHAVVVAASNDLVVAGQHGADRQAALRD